MNRRADPQRPSSAGPAQAPAPARTSTYTPSTPSTTAAEVLDLQSKVGNAAVQRVLPSLAMRAHATKAKAVGVTSPPGKAGTMRVDLGGIMHTVGIESFSFGGTAPRDIATGMATGKHQLDNVRIGRHSDDLSPLLMNALSTHQQCRSLHVDLVEPATETEPARTFAYSFTNARAVDVSESGGAGAGDESVAFAFAGMSMTGPPPRADKEGGGVGGGAGSAGTMTIAGLSAGAADFGLQTVSWNVKSPTDAASGHATGRHVVQHVIITKQMDEHSPALLDALTTNKILKTASLQLAGSAADQKGPPAAASTMDLVDVKVDSVQQSGGAHATETVAFSFGSFDLSSSAQERKAGGKPVDAPAQLLVKAAKSGQWDSPVLEWDWGITSPRDLATGQASGKRQHQEFRIVVPSGPTTVHFLAALQSNEILKDVFLSPKSGPGYALSTARVTDLQLDSGLDGQTTAVRLAYTAIAQETDKVGHQDQWGDEGGAASVGAAKGNAGTPGPGKAGRMRVELGGTKRELPIESFSLGSSAPREAGTGMATGRARVGNVELTRQADGASPLLFQAISTNRDLKTLEVDVVEPATKTEPARTFTYKFDSSHLVALTESGGGKSGGIERLGFSFAKMEMSGPPLAKGETEVSEAGGPDAAGQMQLVGIGDGSADFPVSSVDFGAAAPKDVATGLATGKHQMKQLTITKKLDALSPKLQGALMNNAVIASGTVTLGGVTTSLTGIRLDAIQQSSEGHPIERVSFSYASFSMDAKLGGKVEDAPAELTAVLTKQGRVRGPVLHWDWGSSAPTDAASGLATGRHVMKDFAVTVPTGPSTVQLLAAIQANESLQSATLKPKSGVAYTITDATVADVQLTAGPGGSTTTIRFVYQKVAASSGSVAFEDSRQLNV